MKKQEEAGSLPAKEEALATLADEALAERGRIGEELAMECLLHRYKPFVRARARGYFLMGADREDLVQEGMIGLYKAARDFRSEMNCMFRTFAELCVTRQMLNAIKMAARQKHIPLNSSVSLSRPVFDGESQRTLGDIIDGSRGANPEELYIGREERAGIEGKIGELLSAFETEVLVLYIQGKSYQDIARTMDRSSKAVDNALQRAKRKLVQHLQHS